MEPIVRFVQETVALLAGLVKPAAKSVRDNSSLAVLSVVLAFGLWIFVKDAENPTTTRVLPEDISVQAVKVPADVALADPLNPVRVRVRVADDVFNDLSSADFEATVDLEGLRVGAYDLPVQVRALTSRGGLRVEDVLPDKVHVALAQLITKAVPVSVDVQGEPTAGFTMGTPAAVEATTQVSGPQDKVDQVTQAVAVIDVSGRTEDVDQAVRLVPRDSRGFLVQGVTLDPPLTNLTIDIQQQQFTRALVVSPQLKGTPADGYNVLSVSVNPPSVTVRGSKEFIEGAVDIQTRSVDISDAADDVVRTVSLDVPPGASVAGNVPTVTVTVKIGPGFGLQTFGVPVTVLNLGDGLSIAGALPSVEVTLFGELPRLRALSPADITATIDLGGKDAGTVTMDVKVKSPDGLQMRSVQPSQVQVKLESH